MLLEGISQAVGSLAAHRYWGRVTAILGMLVEIGGVERRLTIGGRCLIIGQDGQPLACEVIGFREGRTLVMPFGPLTGIGLGKPGRSRNRAARHFPRPSLARPRREMPWASRSTAKARSPMAPRPIRCAIRRRPPMRADVFRARSTWACARINTFLTCCRGQRMGIFAGSGVGKSVLLSMLARYTANDLQRDRADRRARARGSGIHRGRSG